MNSKKTKKTTLATVATVSAAKQPIPKAAESEKSMGKKANAETTSAASYPCTSADILARAKASLGGVAPDDWRVKLHGTKGFAFAWMGKKLIVNPNVKIPVLLALPDPSDKNGLDALLLGYIAVHWAFNPLVQRFTAGPDYMTPEELSQILPAPSKAVKKLKTKAKTANAQA